MRLCSNRRLGHGKHGSLGIGYSILCLSVCREQSIIVGRRCITSIQPEVLLVPPWKSIPRQLISVNTKQTYSVTLQLISCTQSNSNPYPVSSIFRLAAPITHNLDPDVPIPSRYTYPCATGLACGPDSSAPKSGRRNLLVKNTGWQCDASNGCGGDGGGRLPQSAWQGTMNWPAVDDDERA